MVPVTITSAHPGEEDYGGIQKLGIPRVRIGRAHTRHPSKRSQSVLGSRAVVADALGIGGHVVRLCGMRVVHCSRELAVFMPPRSWQYSCQ